MGQLEMREKSYEVCLRWKPGMAYRPFFVLWRVDEIGVNRSGYFPSRK